MMAAAGQLAYQEPEQESVSRLSEDKLIVQYLPLVKRSVSQLRSHCGLMLSEEDMEQIGMMALIEAFRRYPGELDYGFLNFAGQRIRGAILDELRRQDWRPRPVRQQAHLVNDKVRQLRKSYGREPTDKEVASALGLSDDDYRESLYAMQAESLKSLDEMFAIGDIPASGDNKIGRFLNKKALSQAMTSLNTREQVIMSLYYQHELNLKEIALTLGLTETRICQLHKLIVSKLQQLLMSE